MSDPPTELTRRATKLKRLRVQREKREYTSANSYSAVSILAIRLRILYGMGVNSWADWGRVLKRWAADKGLPIQSRFHTTTRQFLWPFPLAVSRLIARSQAYSDPPTIPQ